MASVVSQQQVTQIGEGFANNWSEVHDAEQLDSFVLVSYLINGASSK